MSIRPRNPVLLYKIVTPASNGKPGGEFIPGVSEDSFNRVQWTSFEYVDTWGALDSMTLTFEDPQYWLQDNPMLREMESQIHFAFGYEGALTPTQRMTLFRIEPDYKENGQVTCLLRFFSSGVNLGGFRRNALYTQTDPAKRGSKMSATEVAERIAIQNGLTPVIEPCASDVVSTRVEWRQHNKSDLEFLREIAVGLRAASGKTGRYFVQVRNGELRFGPMEAEASTDMVFTYRGANSPLKAFKPILPADMLKGMGYVTGYDGIDPASGERVKGKKDEKTDTNRTSLDRKVIDFDRGTVSDAKKGDTAPKFGPRRLPEFEKRRSDLEAQRNALARGIITTQRALIAQGKSPSEIEAALATDKANYAALGKLIEQASVNNPASLTEKSPFEAPTEQETEDTFRTTLFNMLTANATLWGEPLIYAGKAITIGGVAKRFGRLWWVKEVRHKIDRNTGFTTQLDMQKNALGIGDPSSGKVAPRPNAVDVQYVYNYETGVGQWEAKPAQGYFNAANSGTTPAPQPVEGGDQQTLEEISGQSPFDLGDTFNPLKVVPFKGVKP